MKDRAGRRIFVILMALMLTFSMVPFNVFATETDITNNQNAEQEQGDLTSDQQVEDETDNDQIKSDDPEALTEEDQALTDDLVVEKDDGNNVNEGEEDLR